MKVPYSWLKDFVDITLSPRELADRLTMAGLTVEGLEEKGGDAVFTVEITSNRADWLSVRGIAREAAAITGKKLKTPAKRPSRPGSEKVKVEIEDRKECPLYTARVIRGVSVGQSPEWMRRRLEQVGVRPVNDVVDITNYVLFELGEPLHAFDLDKLAPGPILVREARKGEKLVAIDGKEYALDHNELVIADSRGPVAIAGVMGGKDTEVTGSTKNVLLEAALFDQVLVRRDRQLLGLQSEASYRFERGMDPRLPDEASVRAAGLIEEICGGRVTGTGRQGAVPEKPRKVALDTGEVCRALGCAIAPAAVKRILSALGFGVKSKGAKNFLVDVPSFRRDVKLPADLVEELARIHGYDKIPSELPTMVVQPSEKPSPLALVKQTLIAQGLTEVLTYSLTDKGSVAGFGGGVDAIEIANPLSAEQEILRPVLTPSIARCLAHNLNQRRPAAAVFEAAKVYARPDREKNVLGIGLCGQFSRWFGPQAGNVQYNAGFLGLKGIIDCLLSRLGIGLSGRGYEYDGSDAVTLRVAGKDIGGLRRITGKGGDPFDIKDKELYVAELSLDLLFPLVRRERQFAPFPRFPSVERDITVEMDGAVPAGEALAVARRSGGGLLKAAEFRDYYDRNLPAGRKKITITCVYSAADRTLTEAEVAPAHQSVVNALKEKFPQK